MCRFGQWVLWGGRKGGRERLSRKRVWWGTNLLTHKPRIVHSPSVYVCIRQMQPVMGILILCLVGLAAAGSDGVDYLVLHEGERRQLDCGSNEVK